MWDWVICLGAPAVGESLQMISDYSWDLIIVGFILYAYVVTFMCLHEAK